MGNSAAVAARIELKLPADFSDDVWVFPVYCWGIPPVVVHHLHNAPMRGKRVHMVCTCGDDTGTIDRQWLDLIAARGAECGSVYSVQMPNTYVCLPLMDVDPDKVAAEKLAKAAARVDYIAERLQQGIIETDLHRGIMPRLKSKVIYPWFFNRLMKTGKFAATDSCSLCGLCAKQCPKGNIAIANAGHVEWGSDCTFCLRCYHSCPRHAVRYGRATKGKGQYTHPDFHWLVNKFKTL